MQSFTSEQDNHNLMVMKPLLKDKWFHTYKEDGDITYQGHVLDYAPPQFVLVQLFSWIDGRPTYQKLFNLADHDFHFYDSQEDMCNAWDLHLETFHHITPIKDPEVNMIQNVPCKQGLSCKIHSSTPNGKFN